MSDPPKRGLPLTTAAIAFLSILALRAWGISTHFWLLADQMRDWSIALGRFVDLPLVGPPTHVGGYTIGPAFYWILWAIRLVTGPWFDNLPHAGGIGQAIVQSAADALLLIAIWRRTQSPWAAVTTLVLVATAALDLSLAALVWNPTMGTALAKIATALILLGWASKSTAHVGAVAAVAWSAVHAYTGAVFVAVSVLAALVIDPLIRRDRSRLGRTAIVVLGVVVLLQIPLVAHHLARGSRDSAMGAVTGSVTQVITGQAAPQIAKSLIGLAAAFDFIQAGPWHLPGAGWALLACGVIVAIRYRRDPELLLVTLAPQALAIAGYALFLAGLDSYYYLSLMPAAILTVVLAATPRRAGPLATAAGVAMLAASLALVPARIRFAGTMNRMPEYGRLVEASRKIRKMNQPMRVIRAAFALPPTSDPEYLYTVLGGRIDRTSPWSATIMPDGTVVYQTNER